MLDWKVTEDDPPPTRPLSDGEPPDTPTRGRGTGPRSLWLYAVLVVIAIIAGSAGWVVWQRVQKGDEAMRRDLLAFIRREEQARRLGQRENADNFLPESGIPPGFAVEYERLFKAPIVPVGVEVTLEEFEVVGDTANVLVGVGAQRQRRTYRLTEVGWRRVPLQMEWGEEVRFVDETGITIVAQKEDEEFARHLYEDIPSLMEIFSAWGGTIENPVVVIIRITPIELQGIIPSNVRPGTFNSPQVVELPHHWALSGEAAVRYAVMDQLLASTRPSRPNIFATPQHPRLWDAARQVMALRWAMSPEEYAAVVVGWRTTALADGWQNPFDSLYNFTIAMDPFAPQERQAEMLLVADTLYTEEGLDGLVLLFNTTPTATSWDEAFRAVTGETTAALEARARGDSAPPPVVGLPLTGHLDSSTQMQITMRGTPFLIQGMDTPVVVEGLREATIEVEMGDGSRTTLPGACAALFPEVTIHGTWLEEGFRLRATSLNVRDFTTAFVQGRTPPSDTVAYLNIDTVASDSAPATRQLAALLPDGTTVPLLTWSLPNVYPMFAPPSAASPDKAIYLQGASFDNGCPAVWYARYIPEAGIDGVWLHSWDLGATYSRLLWDGNTNQGIVALVNSIGMDDPYWRIAPGENTILAEPDGTLPNGDVGALRPGMEEATIVTNQRRSVQRVELGTGRVAAEYPITEAGYATAFAYDATGRYLVVGNSYRDSVNPGVERSIVTRYDLATATAESLWSPSLGVVYNLLSDAHDPVWYAATFAPEAGPALYLLGQGEPRPFFTSTVEDMYMNLIACQSGGAVYIKSVQAGETTPPSPADPQFLLTRVASDGSAVYADIPLPPNGSPVLCP